MVWRLEERYSEPYNSANHLEEAWGCGVGRGAFVEATLGRGRVEVISIKHHLCFSCPGSVLAAFLTLLLTNIWSGSSRREKHEHFLYQGTLSPGNKAWHTVGPPQQPAGCM